MKNKYYLFTSMFVVFSIIISFLIYERPYISLECPDTKEPVMILKDLSSAFPVYTASYSSNLEIALKYLKNLETSVQGNIKNNIVKLRENLTQESSRYETMLKTILLSVQLTPCDKESRKQFWLIINKLNNKGIQILALTNQLETNNNDTNTSNINHRNDKRIESIRSFIRSYRLK